MSGGVGAALDEAVADLPDGDSLVQGALFELDATEIGDTEAPSPLSRALTTKPAKRGRPAGARNRRTEAVAGWLLSQHRHPLSVMMEAYSMRPADLARRIGLKTGEDGNYSNDVLLDLLKLQLRMAEAVAPYVAQKMPLAVAADLKAGLTLSFEGVSLPAQGRVSGISDSDRGQAIEAMHVQLPFKSDE